MLYDSKKQTIHSKIAEKTTIYKIVTTENHTFVGNGGIIFSNDLFWENAFLDNETNSLVCDKNNPDFLWLDKWWLGQ